jgi:hypothetical protein
VILSKPPCKMWLGHARCFRLTSKAPLPCPHSGTMAGSRFGIYHVIATRRLHIVWRSSKFERQILKINLNASPPRFAIIPGYTSIKQMRLPTWPSLIRTFYTLSNYTARTQTPFKALQPSTRLIKSMPTIPFIGSFFSSNSSSKMSFPVQKSDDEWQAVLSKGMFP